jgi:hypothetical protein
MTITSSVIGRRAHNAALISNAMPKARCAALLYTKALVPTVEDACRDEVAAGVNRTVYAPDFLRRHIREGAQGD